MKPWSIAHPAMLEITAGATRTYALEMRHSQRLSAITDCYGRFLHLEEDVPALLNYARLRMPILEDEIELRRREWVMLESAGMRGIDLFAPSIHVASSPSR